MKRFVTIAMFCVFLFTHLQFAGAFTINRKVDGARAPRGSMERLIPASADQRMRTRRSMMDVAAAGGLMDPLQFAPLPSSPFVDATAVPSSPIHTEAPQGVSVELETEVLTDVSHVVLDFSSFLTPSKSVLRLCSVVGRVLILSVDYLPDHRINPEELAIQLFLLAVSLKDILAAGFAQPESHRRTSASEKASDGIWNVLEKIQRRKQS